MATKKRSARKAATKGASEEIRKEMHAAKAGKLKNEKQAIAIGLSKARRAGKDVPPPKKGTASAATRKKAEQDIAAGRARKSASKKRSGGKKAASKKSTAKKSATKKSATKKSTRKSAAKRR
jgi:Family of unknown function (DUF6496)